MQLRLPKLQKNYKAKNIQFKGLKVGWEDIKGILHYKNLFYISKNINIICCDYQKYVTTFIYNILLSLSIAFNYSLFLPAYFLV